MANETNEENVAAGDVEVGEVAPDFRLMTGDGRAVSLGDYRGKSHVILFFVRAYE